MIFTNKLMPISPCTRKFTSRDYFHENNFQFPKFPKFWFKNILMLLYTIILFALRYSVFDT